MRSILASLLALPIYLTLDFGWIFIFILALQILGSCDFKFSFKLR